MLSNMRGFEWLIILGVIILIFGVGRLANIGPALGKSIRGFKKAVKGEDEENTTSTPATKQEKPTNTTKPQ